MVGCSVHFTRVLTHPQLERKRPGVGQQPGRVASSPRGVNGRRSMHHRLMLPLVALIGKVGEWSGECSTSW